MSVRKRKTNVEGHLEWPNILAKLEVGCTELKLWRNYFTNRQDVVVGKAE